MKAFYYKIAGSITILSVFLAGVYLFPLPAVLQAQVQAPVQVTPS